MTRTPIHLLLVLTAVGAPVLHARLTGQTAQQSSGAFVILGGQDTIATQRFMRSDGELRGEMRQVYPNDSRITYTVRYESNELKFDFVEVLNGRELRRTATVSASGIQASLSEAGVVTWKWEARTTARAIAQLPLLLPTIEDLLRAARPEVGQSSTLLTYNVRQGDTLTASVVRLSADSVVVTGRISTMRLAVSPTWDILGGLMIYPARTWTIVRLPSKE